MFSTKQNTHHSKLPKLGEVGFISTNQQEQRKCIVLAYPLCDSADYRYSLGIHTCFVRFLDNGEVSRYSGFWFIPMDYAGFPEYEEYD